MATMIAYGRRTHQRSYSLLVVISHPQRLTMLNGSSLRYLAAARRLTTVAAARSQHASTVATASRARIGPTAVVTRSIPLRCA